MIAPLLTILIMLGAFTTTGYAAPTNEVYQQGAIVTPYQQAVQEMVNGRTAQGLSAPSMRTSLSIDTVQRESLTVPGTMVTTEVATATTVVEFDNPQQLGLDAWPPLTIGVETADGNVVQVNVDGALQAQLEAQGVNIDYDQAPTTFTTVETVTRTDSDLAPAPTSSREASATISTNEDILIGFTMEVIGFQYNAVDSVTKGSCPVGCAQGSYDVGFGVGFDAGLRLPGRVDLSGPDQVEVGDDYYVQATYTGENWSASDYQSVGVPGMQGKEFLVEAWASWHLKASYKLCGLGICGGDSIDWGNTYTAGVSKQFTTPLGGTIAIDFPEIELVGIDFLLVGHMGVGLDITPHVGSDKLTANWEAVGGTNCEGSGTVTFTSSGSPVNIGPITACDNGNPDNEAEIELTDFRYWFTIFQIQFDINFNFDISVGDWELWGFSVTLYSFTLDVSDFVTSLVQPYIQDHFGCTLVLIPWDIDCSTLHNKATFTTTTVDTTAPETTLTPTGTMGNNNWWVSNVKITLEADDEADCGSGVGLIEYRIDGGSWTTYSVPFWLTTEGTRTVDFRAEDNDGNLETYQTEVFKIDKTKPFIDGYPLTSPNGAGWWNDPVTIHFDAYDLPLVVGSGLLSVTGDQVLGEGENQSVEGVAEDYAGWKSYFTVGNIDVDLTDPSLTIYSPESLTYPNTTQLLVDWEASDLLSGIASETGLYDGSVPYNDGDYINLLLEAGGEHTFSVEVIDVADNVTFDSVTFWVSVDINGMIASVEEMCSLGLIDNAGICNALLSKLQNAMKKIDDCQLNAAEGMLGAFINQVNAQNGNSIDGSAAGVLTTNANIVLSQLPDCEPVIGNDPGDNPGTDPGDNPGTDPGDNPGNGPTDNPGNGPIDNPGNGPADNPGNGPTDNPGNGPTDNPGNGPTDNPGNGPNNNPGNGPAGNPGKGPNG